jgi:hypothetical protein
MKTRLAAIALAAFVAAPAIAGQPNGRDSVYAGNEASSPRPSTAAVNPIPLGRDSVYATAKSKTTKPVSVAVTLKPGRA